MFKPVNDVGSPNLMSVSGTVLDIQNTAKIMVAI